MEAYISELHSSVWLTSGVPYLDLNESARCQTILVPQVSTAID